MGSAMSVVLGSPRATRASARSCPRVRRSPVARAEAAMRKLDIEVLHMCPWALREGVIFRQLDHNPDLT